MKRTNRLVGYFLLTILLATGISLRASRTPSALGSWQIVSDQNDRSVSRVEFYDHHHQLLYSEKLQGVRLDLRRRPVRKKLDELLQQLMLAKHGRSLLAGSDLVTQSITMLKCKVRS